MPPKRNPFHAHARHQRRQHSGPLRNQMVSHKTLMRYWTMVQWFFQWVSMFRPAVDNEAQLDFALQDYIEVLWDVNCGLEVAQATVAGLQHHLRHSVRLAGSWRLLNVWRRSEPPARAPPMPTLICHAMAMLAMVEHDPFMALSLLLCFHAYLRTGELLTLRMSQIFVDTQGNVIIALGRSKTGKRRGEDEFSIIDAGPIATLVSWFIGLHPGNSLFAGRELHAWRQRFKICDRGHWSQERTAKMYIREAASLLNKLALPPQLRARLEELAAQWTFPS